MAVSALPRRTGPSRLGQGPAPPVLAFAARRDPGPSEMALLRLPPDKTLGDFSELGTNYEGSYKPARMGLRRVLDGGKMRNPLQMQQAAASWSARRPLSASSTSSQQGARAQSAGRARGVGSGRLTVHDGEKAMLGASGSAAVAHDRGPGMLQPQRIELPAYLNTPARRPDHEHLPPEERTHAIRRIQDLELLTYACRRASKVREEGRAHFSMGVLRDNLGQYQKAMESYNHFLRICGECNDNQGCALAYHCMAVGYQLLGAGNGGGGSAEETAAAAAAAAADPAGKDGAGGTTVKPELLRKAIFYHNKHHESSDSVGKFVARLNMGLAYAQLGEKEASTVNHQYALRYALQLHSLEGQSLAIGSLSFSAGMYDNDPEKMRVLIERYVDLCSTLKQPKNQASALKKLGIIASRQGDNDQSISYFQQAIDCARAQGDREAEKDCSVRLGIAAGQAKMQEHLSNILQQSMVRG